MKLLMLKGLPASGKSTHAKKLADDGWVRVNKDDLRAMLNNGKWSGKNEQYVLQLRDQIVSDSLAAGKSVVVDDTNLAPKHAERLKQLAQEHGAAFETKFFDVDVEECVRRDLARPASVGEKVIRDMYKQFLAPPVQVYTPPEGKPAAILCDIDGTLAHGIGVTRKPYEWDKVGTDTLDETVAGILRRYWSEDPMNDEREPQIVLLSGRDGSCEQATRDWLHKHGIRYDALFMRAVGDMRKDHIVKRELFEQHVRENYRVLFVLDDRNQVVDMWRSLGLKCLQVAPGDF